MPFRALPIKPRVPIMTTSSHNPAGRASAIDPGAGQIGMAAAVSIGIGGMIGAGIFSILGVVAHAAGSAMWLAFMLGGIVALLSTYSYTKLDSHAHSQSHTNTNSNSNSIPYAYANPDPNTYPYSHSKPDTHSDTDATRCYCDYLGSIWSRELMVNCYELESAASPCRNGNRAIRYGRNRIRDRNQHEWHHK